MNSTSSSAESSVRGPAAGAVESLIDSPVAEQEALFSGLPNSSTQHITPPVIARQLEQISAAASLFSLQLDHAQLLQELARQAVDILRADQCNVYKALEHGLTLGARQCAHDQPLELSTTPHADVDG